MNSNLCKQHKTGLEWMANHGSSTSLFKVVTFFDLPLSLLLCFQLSKMFSIEECFNSSQSCVLYLWVKSFNYIIYFIFSFASVKVKIIKIIFKESITPIFKYIKNSVWELHIISLVVICILYYFGIQLSDDLPQCTLLMFVLLMLSRRRNSHHGSW